MTGVPTAGTKKVNYVQMAQEISSIALWNPVASIICASSLLPSHSTQTSLPKNVGDINNNFTEIGNNSNLLNAISDFSIAVDGHNQYRPMVVSPHRHALKHESKQGGYRCVLDRHIR